jgi:hypothetical protein
MVSSKSNVAAQCAPPLMLYKIPVLLYYVKWRGWWAVNLVTCERLLSASSGRPGNKDECPVQAGCRRLNFEAKRPPGPRFIIRDLNTQ